MRWHQRSYVIDGDPHGLEINSDGVTRADAALHAADQLGLSDDQTLLEIDNNYDETVGRWRRGADGLVWPVYP